MARATGRLRVVNVSVDAIDLLADSLGQLDARSFAQAAALALNDTTAPTYDAARDRISEGINLTDAYLRRRMEVEPATDRKTSATILAKGDYEHLTRLATYDAQMVIVPRTSRAKNRNTGALGIPQGQKQSGVRVTVRRGGEKTMDSAFLLKLRQGTRQGDKYGVFIREGERLRHLYGPSVYQLFRYQAPRIAEDAAALLETNLLARVGEKLKDILK